MEEAITYSPELQCMIDLWHCAANANDTNAQFELASRLLKSRQTTALQKAFALFKKLAHQDYTTVQTEARYMLAKCYENGYGIQKSYPRAIRWYEKACDNIVEDLRRNPDPKGDAVNALVEKLYEGKIPGQNMDDFLFGDLSPEKIACMTEAAESGDVDAQIYLMDLYNGGAGDIGDDQEESAYWAEKAAENGDKEAMGVLGERYYFGRGVERDFKRAFYWLKKAAARGCQSAVYRLGAHYHSFKNNKEAVKWFGEYARLRIIERNKRLGWEKERPARPSKS